MQIGDQVVFYALANHRCGGIDCEAKGLCVAPGYSAVVTQVHDDDLVDLDVDFPEDSEFPRTQTEMPRATTSPPASGTWLPANLAR